MFAPGSPSSISARTGLPLLRPCAGVAHVEMGVERDQPDLVERAAEPEHAPAGSPHCCRRPAGSAHAPRRSRATASRIGGVACSIVSPASSTSPRSAIRVCKLAPGLDVVAADPPQRRAQQRRRLVARARRHRPGGERRAEQADRRIAVARRRAARQDWASCAIALTRSTGAALRRSDMWDRLLVDCHVATMEPAPRRSARHRRATPRSASTTARSSASASAPSWPASAPAEVVAARRRLGHARADRLPHPSGLRRQPRRRACHAPRRRDLRGDRQGRRRHRLDRRQDPRRVRRRAARQRPPPPARADGAAAAPRSRSSRATASTRPARCACSMPRKQLGESEPVRIVATLLALHALAARPGRPPRRLCRRGRRRDDPGGRQGRPRDQRRRLLRNHRLHPRRGRARCSPPPRAHGLRVRLHAEQLSATSGGAATRRAATRAVRRPSRASRRGRRRGDGRGRHRRGAAARRFLCAAGNEQAAGRPAARLRRADRRRDRLQPRHLAAAVADAGDEHGLHPVRPDARRRRSPA